MENAVMAEQGEAVDDNYEQQPFIPSVQPSHVHLGLGREQQDVDKCSGFVLNIFKTSLCSLGLWSHYGVKQRALWRYNELELANHSARNFSMIL